MSSGSHQKAVPSLLQLQNVSKSFGGVRAVNDVSFEITKGETVGLIGPNGAGKTTLFNLITGFLRPSDGTILFEGRHITGASTSTIVNLGIARTFQIVRSFLNITVLESVLVGALSARTVKVDRRDCEEIAIDALSKVRLEQKKARLVSELTHGEQKRLDVARSIATCPRLVLLDEPFGGLGSNEIGPMSDLVKVLPDSGITLLLVEHRMKELMRNVKRVLVMDQGRLIAQGTPAEVVNETKVIEAYLGRGGGNIARNP